MNYAIHENLLANKGKTSNAHLRLWSHNSTIRATVMLANCSVGGPGNISPSLYPQFNVSDTLTQIQPLIRR